MIEALKVNKFGRTNRTGITLDQDMRSQIIDRILQEGGDRVTGYIPRSFRYFSRGIQAFCKYHHKDLAKFLRGTLD